MKAVNVLEHTLVVHGHLSWNCFSLSKWSMVANVESAEFSCNIQNSATQRKQLYIHTLY